MVQPQVIQGTSEELTLYLQQHRERRDLLLIIPAVSEAGDPSAGDTGQMLRFGMFPQLRGLTEEDFRSAEWHGDDSES